MKKLKLKIMLISFLLVTLLTTCKVQAALQSRTDGTSVTNKTANEFFTMIRNMETDGGTLGLSAVLDDESYLDTTKNGVDVHMAKNTEWRGVALLAASVYGKAGSGTVNFATEKTNGSATTGNATGVYQMAEGTYEYVAGIWDNSTNTNMSIIYMADSRYKEVYTSETSKSGDATIETKGWKGSSSGFVGDRDPVFKRSINGLFGYSRGDGSGPADAGNPCSRAVLVVGAGL